MPDGASQITLESDTAREALAGLLATPKTLPAKLLYDEAGCALFDDITRLPEYYVTRTERALLVDVASRLTRALPPCSAVVEYGASSADKALILLHHMRQPSAYVPIDVAEDALRHVASHMAEAMPRVRVYPICADFLEPITIPDAIGCAPRVGFFPGSTIGNLDPQAAVEFLGSARAALGNGAFFIVGVDLRKDISLLLPAYDDASGVTAAFNLNLLVRLNREAGANFDVTRFAHSAVWNEAEGRIEMHLVSLQAQSVGVAGQLIRFRDGETIHTENSYKHSVAGFTALASRAGWRSAELWKDARDLFCIHLLQNGD